MKFLPLKKQKEITRVLKMGKRFYAASLTAVFMNASEPRFAVCVGKKYGKSVIRNRLKRLLREAFRAVSDFASAPFFVLLIPRPDKEYSYEGFKRDMEILLAKWQHSDSSSRRAGL